MVASRVHVQLGMKMTVSLPIIKSNWMPSIRDLVSWDSVIWDLVIWDLVIWDLVIWDLVTASSSSEQNWQVLPISNQLVKDVT